ncbi:MAG: hypothetical protein EOO47_21975 [Flavobacterium sp.]|nr:MAG: hypothetical protein EOO47_21975 [Flavobacterium sp.]
MSKAEAKKEVNADLIIAFVEERDKVSTSDYTTEFGGSGKTASRMLNSLVEEGILDREGEKKGRRYLLKRR